MADDQKSLNLVLGDLLAAEAQVLRAAGAIPVVVGGVVMWRLKGEVVPQETAIMRVKKEHLK